MSGHNKKKFSPIEDTFTTSQGSSVNGSISRKYYYKNGQRCDIFGRTRSDIGHTPVIGNEQHIPISYPTSNQYVNKKIDHPKKNFYKTWGLDSGTLLEINKNKLISLSEMEVNVRALNLLNSVEERVNRAQGKSKSIHFKLFNPRNRNISRLIINDDVLWHYMNYPIQVTDVIVPKVSYKDKNINMDIKQKFMSTN